MKEEKLKNKQNPARQEKKENAMKKIVSIEGMTCGHCAMHVEESLKGICGVESVKADLKEKNATLELVHEVADADIMAGVKAAGYKAVSVVSL